MSDENPTPTREDEDERLAPEPAPPRDDAPAPGWPPTRAVRPEGAPTNTPGALFGGIFRRMSSFRRAETPAPPAVTPIPTPVTLPPAASLPEPVPAPVFEPARSFEPEPLHLDETPEATPSEVSPVAEEEEHGQPDIAASTLSEADEPFAQPGLFDAPVTPGVPIAEADEPGVEADEPPLDLVEPMPPPVPPLTAEAETMPLPDPDLDPETPEEIAEDVREAALIAQGGLFSRFAWPSHPRYWNGYLAVLTGLATLSILMFVLVEPSPRWILLVAAGAVGIGLDGVLRATWRASFAEQQDTTPYLFLPALYLFAAPILIEHNTSGHPVLLWGIAAGVGFGTIAVAEVLSVRTGSRLYPYARMVTTGAAYFTAFSLLSMTYVLHLGLVPALLATWLVGTMLTIEIVREGEVDPVETAIFAAVAGLVLAQVRWLLYFVPVDGYLAGLTLVLVFYLLAGVLHSYVLRQLTLTTAAEYALVTTIGLVLAGAARAAGLA